MALKQPTKPDANGAVPENTTQPQLPPPQTFDVLPALHELLARVDAYNNQSIAGHETELPSLLDDSPNQIGSSYAELTPLNPKDFPEAAGDIKSRIRSAQRELEKLPDMDRSIEEQEEEIAELEAKIERQREMMRELAQVASKMQGRLGALGE